MKKILYSLAVCLSLAALAACEENHGMDPEMLNAEGLSLEVNGRIVQNFAESQCQMTFSPSRNEFRVGDDKMTEYYILKCNKVPTAKGETLNVDLSWTQSGSLQSRSGLRFVVEKIGDDGRVWLWDEKDAIAAIIYKSIY